MGNSLSPETVAAFVDELSTLEKGAGIRTLLRGATGAASLLGRGSRAAGGGIKEVGKGIAGLPKSFQEAGSRLLHPVAGVKKGLRELTPALQSAEQRSASFMGLKPGAHLTSDQIKLMDIVKERGLAAPHLRAGKTRGRMLAEELSRRGWTGRGSATKYLPVGMKGMTVGFGASAIPEAMEASKRRPSSTGEGGPGEALGREALGTLGFLGAGTLGLMPAMAMYGLASKAGGGVGRVIDRLRGGASVPTAVSAPSPQEAQQQLTNIQRYYG